MLILLNDGRDSLLSPCFLFGAMNCIECVFVWKVQHIFINVTSSMKFRNALATPSQEFAGSNIRKELFNGSSNDRFQCSDAWIPIFE